MPDRTMHDDFTQAFEQYADELFRHAVLRLSDRERATELTQETFLRTLEFLERGETVQQYRAFFYRVLNNLIIDEYRKHKSVSLDAMLQNEETATALEASLLRDDFDLFESAATRFDAAHALKAMERLPDAYKTVLILRYIESLTPTEIASALGETENAVSVRIHRAIGKLRDLLSSYTDVQP